MRDFCVLCIGIIVAVTLAAKLRTFVPAAMVICFAFLTFHMEDAAVIDYMRNAVRYFVLTQQFFRWEASNLEEK